MLSGGIVRACWLFAVCGLEIAAAAIYFKNAGQVFHSQHTVVLLGRLALATGACAIAAAIRTAPRDWLLALNGLSFGMLGLVLNGVFGSRIGFRTIAFLILISAISMAAVEWRVGQLLQRGGQNSRALVFRGAAYLLLLFAIVFGVLTATGLRTAPGSSSELLLLGFYFAVSAVSVLALILNSREMSLRA